MEKRLEPLKIDIQKVSNSLPSLLRVGGVPLLIRNTDEALNAAGLISQSYIEKQLLSVLSTLPIMRQHRLICGECAWQLLYAAGLDMSKCSDMQYSVGPALHNTLRDNSFEWVRDFATTLPTSIIVNGMPYKVRTDYDDLLNAKDLAGECSYTDSEIRLLSTLEPIVMRVIACHEMTHALLYESGYDDKNNETLVQPLGRFLYLFIHDNNFDFMRGCEP